jgi:hypothetical protein
MGHGGRREGAGRKPSSSSGGPAFFRKGLRLTISELIEFEQLQRPGENWSEMVRRVLRQAAHVERLRRAREAADEVEEPKATRS